MTVSRREFVKIVTSSGIVLGVSRLTTGAEPTFRARETLPGATSWNPSATGQGRVDGIAKVTGAKLYASDFRAADLPGWPARTSHALLLRAPDATHVYLGLDLGSLGSAMNPAVVVTATEVAKHEPARAGFLRRRAALLPRGEDAALSRPACRAA